MAIPTELAVPGRRVAIDGHGRLHPTEGDPIDVIADELHSVVVLWNRDDGTSWLGWLTMASRRSVPFSAIDLEDPIFQNWLRALPRWEHDKLWHATTNAGHHLVWRRR